jgi:hypothetical protein
VHGEKLVVLLFRGNNFKAWRKELGTNDQRHYPANQEINKRRNQVEIPNLFVVGGGQPIHKDIAFFRNPNIRDSGWKF